jgi:hypothetical protein
MMTAIAIAPRMFSNNMVNASQTVASAKVKRGDRKGGGANRDIDQIEQEDGHWMILLLLRRKMRLPSKHRSKYDEPHIDSSVLRGLPHINFIKTGAPNKRQFLNRTRQRKQRADGKLLWNAENRTRPPDRLSHPRNETCLPISKDTIIVRGFPPPSATRQSKQSEKPLKPVSTKSGEGHCRCWLK